MLAQVIVSACRDKAPVMVVPTDFSGTLRGWFSDFTKGSVTVDLRERPLESQFKPFSQCVLFFRRENYSYCFISSVKSLSSEVHTSRLVLRAPDQVASERRSSVRFPILEESQLSVSIFLEGEGEYPARGVDISLTGIQVEFPEGKSPDVPLDSPVEAWMELPDYPFCCIEGILRRQKDRCFGIFFPGTVTKEGQIEPPEPLARIVRSVEKDWLRSRKAERTI